MKKLDCVLLVDDDNPTNFLHKYTIEKGNYARKVKVAKNGIEAIDYLKGDFDEESPRPNLILLDINMPGMDGWEFLEAYNNLEVENRAEIVIVMLTTSINPTDEENARETTLVNDFLNKPLTEEMLEEVLKKFF